MLLVLIYDVKTAGNLLRSSLALSQNLKKEFGILRYVENDNPEHESQSAINRYLQAENIADAKIFITTDSETDLALKCEYLEVSFLMIQWNGTNKTLKNCLKYCRDLRIPYLFFKSSFPELNLDKVMVPVGFLVEEYEKAQFASAFGRFCNSEITLLQANDYGSKAAVTIEKMKLVFDKFQFNYIHEKATSDSYKLDKEAVRRAEKANYGIVIVSASRDYGLDDWIFGAKESHLIKQSNVPLLLINPRSDLYTLCD
ncbi:MAG: hypothetical protein ACK5KP_10565 [Paludibacteraceae bacterium]